MDDSHRSPHNAHVRLERKTHPRRYLAHRRRFDATTLLFARFLCNNSANAPNNARFYGLILHFILPGRRPICPSHPSPQRCAVFIRHAPASPKASISQASELSLFHRQHLFGIRRHRLHLRNYCHAIALRHRTAHTHDPSRGQQRAR